ncbi:MAG: 50S ribosomal protein L18 [Patescibacteria group bacterium]|jgi:large subunit ribosomal protein L18
MKNSTNRHIIRKRRVEKIRARIHGTATHPRLSLYRSNNHLEAQLIDDAIGKTLCAVHDRLLKSVKPEKGQTKNIAVAHALGSLLAEKAKAKKIVTVVFDRRGAKYHGRVRAFAEGARAGGLNF